MDCFFLVARTIEINRDKLLKKTRASIRIKHSYSHCLLHCATLQDNWMHAQLSNLPAYESMPPEIISNILLLTPGVLTDAQAKRHREELMKGT